MISHEKNIYARSDYGQFGPTRPKIVQDTTEFAQKWPILRICGWFRESFISLVIANQTNIQPLSHPKALKSSKRSCSGYFWILIKSGQSF